MIPQNELKCNTTYTHSSYPHFVEKMRITRGNIGNERLAGREKMRIIFLDLHFHYVIIDAMLSR